MDKNTNFKSVEIRLKFYLGLTTSQAQNIFWVFSPHIIQIYFNYGHIILNKHLFKRVL